MNTFAGWFSRAHTGIDTDGCYVPDPGRPSERDSLSPFPAENYEWAGMKGARLGYID